MRRCRRVNLVVPPIYVDPSRDYVRFSQSQGLPLIKANLPSEVEVDFFDAGLGGFDVREETSEGMLRVGFSPEQILARLDGSDLVGISCNFSTQFPAAVEIAILARSLGIPSVLGGVHASFDWAAICGPDSPFDYVALGDGIQALRDLIAHLQGDLSLASLGNALPCRSIRLRRMLARIPQCQLAALEIPDYTDHNEAREAAQRAHGQWGIPVDWMCVVFSMGCPFACDFCSTVRMASRFNVFSEEQIRMQLRQIRSLGYRYVVIMDDNLLTHRRQAIAIFHAMAEEGLRAIYDGGIYVNFCDDEAVEAMALVCDRVFVALERQYPYAIDKFFRVNPSPENLEYRRAHLLESFREAGVKVSAYLTIGHPDEDQQSILSTIRYAHHLRAEGFIDYAALHLVTAYPGTPLWENCWKRGILELPRSLTPGAYKIYSTSFGNIRHPSVSRQILQEWLHQARLEVNGPAISAFERCTLERQQIPTVEGLEVPL
jgi:radical SAM superfamily enzyme YgiQ (UPF0313 family)